MLNIFIMTILLLLSHCNIESCCVCSELFVVFSYWVREARLSVTSILNHLYEEEYQYKHIFRICIILTIELIWGNNSIFLTLQHFKFIYKVTTNKICYFSFYDSLQYSKNKCVYIHTYPIPIIGYGGNYYVFSDAF